MLEFPISYFEREERNGHVVGEIIKKAWAVQLEILEQIDIICKKYDLTYYAYWGTLLGAVRHKGFIPWDDDVDIAMKREDYSVFLEVAPKELPEGFCVLNDYTEKTWENNLSRVVNSRTVDYEDDKMQKFYNCPFALGIDIFPLDYIPRDEVAAMEQKQVLTFIGTLMTVLEERKKEEEKGTSIEELEYYNQEIAASLVKLEDICGIYFENDKALMTQLYILYDQVASLFAGEESDSLTMFTLYLKRGYRVDKECFDEVIMLPFENRLMPVPKGYDTILRGLYGDYMTPVKGTSSHGEIGFLGQIEVLANSIDVRVKRRITEDEENAIFSVASERISGNNIQKVVMICNSTSGTLAHDGIVVKRLRQIFREYEEKEDVLIWWRPSRIDIAEIIELKRLVPQLIEEYKELVQEFREKEMGIFDEGIHIAKVLELCDMYYGDEGKIAKLFRLSEKEVEIIEYTI